LNSKIAELERLLEERTITVEILAEEKHNLSMELKQFKDALSSVDSGELCLLRSENKSLRESQASTFKALQSAEGDKDELMRLNLQLVDQIKSHVCDSVESDALAEANVIRLFLTGLNDDCKLHIWSHVT
jgi:hypothetical protein